MHRMMRTVPLSMREQLLVAVEAVSDPRTVKRFLQGKAVRESSRTRIEKALKRLGLDVVVNAGVKQ